MLNEQLFLMSTFLAIEHMNVISNQILYRQFLKPIKHTPILGKVPKYCNLLMHLVVKCGCFLCDSFLNVTVGIVCVTHGLAGLYDAVSGAKDSHTGQSFTSPGRSAIQMRAFSRCII